MATEQVNLTAFIVKTENILKQPTTKTFNLLVVVLQGINSSAIDHASPYIQVETEPDEDGRQVACVMLADGKIALRLSAIYSARAFFEFFVLWAFDDATYLTRYPVSENLDERMFIAHAVAGRIQILTQEEIRAWQEVAQTADFMRIFHERDIRDDEI
ncbi:hypothetical protein [Paraburkholderia caribensis]|nr:hypothetical protein [Paraburkholderia caribensis]